MHCSEVDSSARIIAALCWRLFLARREDGRLDELRVGVRGRRVPLCNRGMPQGPDPSLVAYAPSIPAA